MCYNVFQPIVNALQHAVVTLKCIGNVSQCVGNVSQRVEQGIANFINMLGLTIDHFDFNAIKNKSKTIQWKMLRN